MIQEPVAVLAVLLCVLAGLFGAAQHRLGARLFGIVPLLVFAYFVPTLLSNTGVIPLQSPLYEFTKNWLLPAALILLTMSVDIPAVLRLGHKQLILFLGGAASIVVGGPLVWLACGWMVPVEQRDQAWRGLAALSGSWIGGSANFVAVGESVKAADSTIAMMVVVDVALSNLWLAVLLFCAGHEETLDRRVGADRRALDQLREHSEAGQPNDARPAPLADLLAILAVGFGGAAVAATVAGRIAPLVAQWLPMAADVLGEFAWKVLLATVIGVGASVTRLRRLERAGASRVGSVLLYLLVASIGAQAEFARVLDVPALLVIGGLWIALHALVLLVLWRVLRAPFFCMAVGSQANIGGAASASIVASAFHPALAPVGALMGVMGYVLGTAAGLLCALLLRWVQ